MPAKARQSCAMFGAEHGIDQFRTPHAKCMQFKHQQASIQPLCRDVHITSDHLADISRMASLFEYVALFTQDLSESACVTSSHASVLCIASKHQSISGGTWTKNDTSADLCKDLTHACP